MKPTQMLEKSTTPTESFQNEHKGKTISRNKKYMLMGVIAFLLVVSAVILSVYFGMEMAKDNYKEYQAVCVDDNGGVVHEKVIVTEKEEIFSNDVATGIADFSTRLITIHITNLELYADKCFVTNLNTSDYQAPKEFLSTHTTSQITFESKHMVKRMYDITDIWLNNNALGTRSAKLCKDKVAFFLRVKQVPIAKVKREDLAVNMIPFPRLHFFMPGFAPLTSRVTTTPQK